MACFEDRLLSAQFAEDWRARLWGSVAFSGVVASATLLATRAPWSQTWGGIIAAVGAASAAWLLRCSWERISAWGGAKSALAAAPLLSTVALIGAYGVAQPAGMVSLPTIWPAAAPVEPWEKGEISFNGNLHCAIQRRFSNGHTLTIAMPRRGPVLLTQRIPDTATAAGKKWPVTIAVDELGAPRTATAHADGDVVIPFGNPEDLERIHSGSVLLVRSESEDTEYRLDGAKQALSALNACVSTLGGK